MIREYRNVFWVSLILMIPIIVLSPTIQSWFKYTISFTGDKYVVLALSTILLVIGGKPFYQGAINELKAKSPNMMSLIALAISISYIYSLAVVFGLNGMDFFLDLASLIVIMLLGHYLEMRSQVSASNALKTLTELMPSEANLLVNGETNLVSIQSLKVNDVVLVRPGDKVPVDGVIVFGKSTFDESMLTGESLPVIKAINDQLIGGTINGDNVVHVKITKIGSDTYLEQVIKT